MGEGTGRRKLASFFHWGEAASEILPHTGVTTVHLGEAVGAIHHVAESSIVDRLVDATAISLAGDAAKLTAAGTLVVGGLAITPVGMALAGLMAMSGVLGIWKNIKDRKQHERVAEIAEHLKKSQDKIDAYLKQARDSEGVEISEGTPDNLAQFFDEMLTRRYSEFDSKISVFESRMVNMFQTLIKRDSRHWIDLKKEIQALSKKLAAQADPIFAFKASDLDVLEEVVDRVRKIDDRTKQIPNLQRWENLDAPTPGSEYIFYYRTPKTAIARDEIWPQLIGFIEEDVFFKWGRAYGSAGAGKSRVALDLCDYCHDLGWETGFLRTHQSKKLNLLNLEIESDTLIVADYGYRRPEDWRDIVVSLSERFVNSQFKLRLLFLDREATGPNWKWAEETDVQGTRYAEDPLVVRTLTDQELTELILGEYNRLKSLGRATAELNAAKAAEAGLALSKAPADARPLFALFAGRALAMGTEPAHWDVRTLSETILKEEHRHWIATNVDDGYLNLLFYATILGRCPHSGEHSVCSSLQPHVPPVVNAATLQKASGLCGPYDLEFLNKISPDAVGELFVLQRLTGKWTINDTADRRVEAEALIRSAISADLEAYSEFIGRAIQNYPGESGVEQLLVMPKDLNETQQGQLAFGWGVAIFSLASERRVGEAQDIHNRLIESASSKFNLALQYALALGLVNAIQEDTPIEDRKRYVAKLESLWEDSEDTDVRVQFAMGLVNATKGDTPVEDRKSYVAKLETLWKDSEDTEITLRYAMCLFNAIQGDTSVEDRQSYVAKLATLWNDTQDTEIRLRYAMGLVNALRDDTPVEDRQSHVAKLATLWNDTQDTEIRVQYSKGLLNAIGEDTPVEDRKSYVAKLEALWKDTQDTDIRLRYAMGLFNAIQEDTLVGDRKSYVAKLETLWKDTQDTEIRLQYAMGLVNALREDTPVEDRKSHVAKLATLWKDSQDTEIRLQYSMSLFNAVKRDTPVEDRKSYVAQLETLWKDTQDAEIRLRYAKVLFNAIQEDTLVEDRKSYVAKLETLWKDTQDTEIRLRYAMGLVNALQEDMSVEDRKGYVAKLETLWKDSQDAEIRLRYAKAVLKTLGGETEIDVAFLQHIREIELALREERENPNWAPLQPLASPLQDMLKELDSL